MDAVVSLRVDAFCDNGNGTLSIRFKGHDMTDEDRKSLQRLYPNLLDRAYTLLNQEALLGLIAPDVEPVKIEGFYPKWQSMIQAKPTNATPSWQEAEKKPKK